jgi:DNA-binding NarL/FixJ family response regulator
MDREIQILLIDDHALFRESVSRLLQTEAGFQVTATCSHLSDALTLIGGIEVDIVLLDYDLEGEYGTDFLEKAKAMGFKGQVLMVTAGMSNEATLRVFEQGASGIFLKHAPPQELVEAIHKIMSGQMWLDSRAVRPLVDGVTRRMEEHQGQPSLGSRELAVLRAVFKGLSNKQIADQLKFSESVVKAILQQLFSKTGVRTRSQLVRFALEHHADDWLDQVTG